MSWMSSRIWITNWDIPIEVASILLNELMTLSIISSYPPIIVVFGYDYSLS